MSQPVSTKNQKRRLCRLKKSRREAEEALCEAEEALSGAETILNALRKTGDTSVIEYAWQTYVNCKHDVMCAEFAVDGARDKLAEILSYGQ